MLFQSQIDQSLNQSHIDRQFQQQFDFRNEEDIHHDDGEQTETKTIENEIKDIRRKNEISGDDHSRISQLNYEKQQLIDDFNKTNKMNNKIFERNGIYLNTFQPKKSNSICLVTNESRFVFKFQKGKIVKAI